METVVIIVKASLDRQALEQTINDMLEYWFDWATKAQVQTEIIVKA